LHISKIVSRVVRVIKEEKKLGLWNHDVPSRRSLERSTNYSADGRWQTPTRTVCVKPGVYFVNPRNFDEETQNKLLEVIDEYKQGKKQVERE